MQKYRNREQIKGCQGLGMKGGSEYIGQHNRILGVMELFCILITAVLHKSAIKGTPKKVNSYVKIQIMYTPKKLILLHINFFEVWKIIKVINIQDIWHYIKIYLLKM